MASLVVGGVPIPVAVSSPSFSRSDAVDRGRVFDNTSFTSQTGGAANDWQFSTPPVTLALAATYKAALGIVSAQLCSGDILELPTMCHTEYMGGKLERTAVGHRVVIDFVLHEVQPARMDLRYTPGAVITGESFTAALARWYRNAAGQQASAAINIKRDAHYDINDLVANSPSLLMELARTNVALWSRDLSNAAWVKTNMTATFNQVGADGSPNSATALTATAANATCTQLVTLASSARLMSAYVFRGIGTGTIEMTTDGGTTWTPITLGGVGAYARYMIPTQTLANPNFGFRIVTSGDAIGVDFVQNENGIFETSPIATTTVAVTRPADLYSLPHTIPPGESTFYAKFIDKGTINISFGRVFQISDAGSTDPRFSCNRSTRFRAQHDTGATDVESELPAPAPVRNNTVELNCHTYGDGSVDITQSINGAASTTAVQSAALPFASAWSGLLCWLNGPTSPGCAAFKSFKIVAGIRSLDEMRAL